MTSDEDIIVQPVQLFDISVRTQCLKHDRHLKRDVH